MTTIHLQPSPVPSGGVPKWSSSGRSLSSALSPNNAELSVFVSPKAYTTAPEVDEDGTHLVGSGTTSLLGRGTRQKEVVPGKVAGVFDQDRAVYFGKWATVDGGLNQLYADSHMIFKTAQELHLLSVATTSTIGLIAATQSTHSFSSTSGSPYPGQSHTQTQKRRGDPFITTSSNVESKFMGSVVPAPKALKAGLAGPRGRGKGSRALSGLKPGQEATRKYRQICDEYAWRLMVVARNEKLDLTTRSKHASIHQILQLAATLYIPADGMGLGLVGEELSYYYNEFADPEGARELRVMVEGAILRERSWEDEDYLEAIMRSVVRGIPGMAIALLQELKYHPQSSIWAFAQLLVHALETLPRSNAPSGPGSNRPKYPNEAIFFQAHQQWRSTFRSDVSVACRGKEKSGGWLEYEDEVDIAEGQDQGEPESWENFFSQVVDVLSGNEDKILEWTDGWKGALGIWGVLVDVTLKRDDLPSVMDTIWSASPADLTSTQEKIEAALLQAEVTKALIHCNDFDLWLAAHLTDILDKMLIVEDDLVTFPISLRDYFILSYTDTLQAVPQYWNLALGYLATCGPEGFGRMRELVVRVGLRGLRHDGSEEEGLESTGGDVDMDRQHANGGHSNGGHATKKDKGKGKAMTSYAQLNAVLEVCSEYQLDEEMREICRCAAATLLKQRRYGEALSYCIQGIRSEGGHAQLAAITDAVLDVYVYEGADEFISAVDSISSGLMRASREDQLQQQPDDHLYPTASYDYQPPNSGTSSQFDRQRQRVYGTHQDQDARAMLGNVDDESRRRLRFLGRYREFLLAMREGDAPTGGHRGGEELADGDERDALDMEDVPRSGKQRAADQVVYMASRTLVPKRFWAVFLLDCVGLLEDDDILFSTTDTYELMRLMEELTVGSRTAPEEYLTTLRLLTASKRHTKANGPARANGNTAAGQKSNGSPASDMDPKHLRFLKSRAEREKIGLSEKAEMLQCLKTLDAFKLAALRNLSRTMLFA